MLGPLKNAGWIAAFVALCAALTYEAINASQRPQPRSHERLGLSHPWKLRPCRDARAWSMGNSPPFRPVPT